MQENGLVYERPSRWSQALTGALGLAVVTTASWLVWPIMFSGGGNTVMLGSAGIQAADTGRPAPASSALQSPAAGPANLPSAPPATNDGSAPVASETVAAIADIPLELVPLPKPRRVEPIPVPRARPQIDQDEPPPPPSTVPERSFFDFLLNPLR